MARYLKGSNGIPRGVEAALEIYDASVVISSPTSSGTPITLPNSGTYVESELQVWWNGQRMENVIDFNYEGTVPRTQVSFTFNLISGDRIRFRIEEV